MVRFIIKMSNSANTLTQENVSTFYGDILDASQKKLKES